MLLSFFIFASISYTLAHIGCNKPCDFPEHCPENPCHPGKCGVGEYCYVEPCKCTHRCLKHDECAEGPNAVHCDPLPCSAEALMNTTILSGFMCMKNPCDCSIAIVGEEAYKCNPNIPCSGCAVDEKCVVDPVDCTPGCAKTNPAPCSEAACHQADCANDEECITDFYRDKCHSRCEKKTACQTCTGACSLGCSNPLTHRCAFDCQCNQFCETCTRQQCPSFADGCASDNDCPLNQECIQDNCGCKSYCQACPESRCNQTTVAIDKCPPSGCGDSRVCDLNKCTCEKECQACDATRCSALGTPYENEDCGGNCPNNFRCVKDECGCKDECQACTCSSYNDQCQTTCPDIGGQPSKCLPVADLCNCTRTCQVCTLDQCENNQLDNKCNSNNDCNFNDGEICQENICACEQVCFKCCDGSENRTACSGCTDCRPTDELDASGNTVFCNTCEFKCYDAITTAPPTTNPPVQNYPNCKRGTGDIPYACNGISTVFCRTSECKRNAASNEDCCENYSQCNPDEDLYQYVRVDLNNDDFQCFLYSDTQG